MRTIIQKKLINHYGSESIDVTLSCRNYLFENNFFKNKEEVNIELLEKNLINYSIFKMADWGIDFDQVGIENWDNLAAILEALNNHIPTTEDKQDFFAQYTRCIIYIYSTITKQPPIKWEKEKNLNANIAYIYENNLLTEMITNESVPAHKIPIDLLAKIKSFYPEKKNPVLEK